MTWFDVCKKDKKDMRVGRVYPSDREGKKIMMLTHEGKRFMQVLKDMAITKAKERIEEAELIPTKSVGLILNQDIIVTNAR